MTRETKMLPEGAAALDARLSSHDDRWWGAFYEDRTKPCPFFGDVPDESLAHWVGSGAIAPGRALDIGCGNARNAVFLARSGFTVDAVDYADTAIAWARERVEAAGVQIVLHCTSIFDLALPAAQYDLVYDSGCFHHIAPHRRQAYVELVTRVLKPGGAFGLATFAPDGGSGYSDDEVYERGSLGGGLGYSEAQLRAFWSAGLQVHEVRRMQDMPAGSATFGKPFLWALLARKR